MIADDRLERAKQIPILQVAQDLGLELKRITGLEHAGPCPECGGNDRFAINTARHVFNCRKCGAGGDQVALVMLARSCDFPAALTHLAGEREAVIDPAEAARRRARAEAHKKKQQEIEATQRARAIRDAREIWASAEGQDVGPAVEYLAGRGIRFSSWPPTLRFCAARPYLKYWPGEGVVEWFRGPCMVAGIQDAGGRVTAVHQTFLDPDGAGKARICAPDGSVLDDKEKPWPAKLVRGSKKGGAIRLTPAPGAGGVLVMGEGIETTASAMCVRAVPGAAYWVGVDLGNMAGQMLKEPGKRNSGRPDLSDAAAFVPPSGLSRLIFLMDGDSAPGPTRAKLLSGLRRAIHHTPALRAEIVAAPVGKDFNDILTGENENEN